MNNDRLKKLAGITEGVQFRSADDMLQALLKELREFGDYVENAYPHDITPEETGRDIKKLYQQYMDAYSRIGRGGMG